MSSGTCCPSPLPPVTTGSYTPKGTYTTYGDLKAYVNAPPNATHGLLIVYDIFGYFPQTLQGADILSQTLNAVVIMPDFFNGAPMDITNYPPDTPVKKAIIGTFFATQALPAPTLSKLGEIMGEVKGEFGPKGVRAWGIVGYCWGAKITSLASGKGSEFVAGVQCHPAFLDPADAKNLTIPNLVLPSADEDATAVAGFKKEMEEHAVQAVKEKSVVNIYGDMFHGWMAARAKLGEEKYKAGYEKAYAQVAQWLKGTLLTK